MFLYGLLLVVALTPATSSSPGGVKVELTQKGLEYGRQLGMATIQTKLKSIKVSDISGSASNVKYSLSNIKIHDVGLPKSAIDLVTGTGVRLSISGAFITLYGDWRVQYIQIIKSRGSFALKVSGLTITTTISIQSDETGRPAVSIASCAVTVGDVKIKFHGGARWMHNLFSKYIDKALRSAAEKKICLLVADAVSDLNSQLKTMNVVAKVDQYAEIEYSMVSSPTISNTSLVLNLKGEFYNIAKHQEPPFSPTNFSMPQHETDNMMYLCLSTFPVNSAFFVYNTAGVLSPYVTDDMIPKISPFRLNTKSFSVFIPQLAKQFPDLLMKLLVKTEKSPAIAFQPNSMTVEVNSTVTAYAIQPNATLSPLFILNMVSSVSARVFVSGLKLAGEVTLNKVDLTLHTSYVGDFQVETLDNVFKMVLKMVVIPRVNALLALGYPLPSIGKMQLVNTKLQLLKDVMLIGTDVQFKA